jgi:hypothetical protein
MSWPVAAGKSGVLDRLKSSGISEKTWKNVAERQLHDWKAGTDDTEVCLDQSPYPSWNEAVGHVDFVLDRTGDNSGAKDTGNGDTGRGVSIAR